MAVDGPPPPPTWLYILVQVGIVFAMLDILWFAAAYFGFVE